ncbi:hypothetical protein VTO42DRAFT_132 [Malbranchea cinnamomea]
MLFLSFLAVATLALWGSLMPVPPTGNRPIQFLKGVAGVARASLLTSGVYEHIVSWNIVNGPSSNEGVDGYAGPVDLMIPQVDLMVLQTIVDDDFFAVPDVYAIDWMPILPEAFSLPQPTYTAMDFDFVRVPSATQAIRYGFLLVAAVLCLGLWLLSLVPRDIRTLARLFESTSKSARFEGSVSMMIDSRNVVTLVVHPSICDAMLASLEVERSLTSEPVKPAWDLVPYFNLAARFPQAPRPVTLSQRLAVADVLDFHPIIGKAIYQLVILVCTVSSDSPLAEDPQTPDEVDTVHSRSNPLEALVPRRLENVSQLAFMATVGFLLASWDDLQAFIRTTVVQQEERAEVGSPVRTGKRNRPGKRARQRAGRRKLIQQQDAIIAALAPPTE